MALTFTNTFNLFRLSGDPAVAVINTNKQAEPNIRVDAGIVCVPWSGDPYLIGKDSMNPDSAGNIYFELSEYFQSILKSSFTFPATAIPKLHANASANFMLHFSEHYGNPPIPLSYIDLPGIYSFNGKIPQYCHNLFYKVYSSFQAKLDAGDTLLSLAHLLAVSQDKVYTRFVSKSDTLKLYIALTETPDTFIRLRPSFQFTDGTFSSDEGFLLNPLSGSIVGNVVEIDVGFDTLGLDSIVQGNYPGKTVESYSIIPYNNFATPLPLKPYSLYLDLSYQPYRKEFFFKNSLGGYDSLITTGKHSSSIEYEHNVIKTSFYAGHLRPINRNIRTESIETVKCNTGHYSRDLLYYLPEFISSTEVYEILDGVMIPIYFHDNKAIRESSEPGLISIDFEYSRSIIPKIN